MRLTWGLTLSFSFRYCRRPLCSKLLGCVPGTQALCLTDRSHPLEITKHFLHYHNNFVRKVYLLHLFYRCDLSKVIQVVVLVQGPEAKPPGLRIVFKPRDHCWAGELVLVYWLTKYFHPDEQQTRQSCIVGEFHSTQERG